jgi:hypothetical protein
LRIEIATRSPLRTPKSRTSTCAMRAARTSACAKPIRSSPWTMKGSSLAVCSKSSRSERGALRNTRTLHPPISTASSS